MTNCPIGHFPPSDTALAVDCDGQPIDCFCGQEIQECEKDKCDCGKVKHKDCKCICED